MDVDNRENADVKNDSSSTYVNESSTICSVLSQEMSEEIMDTLRSIR